MRSIKTALGKAGKWVWKLCFATFRKAADVESRAKTDSTPNMNRWTW